MFPVDTTCINDVDMKDIVEVDILSAPTVAQRIEKLVLDCIRSILTGNAFSFEVPNRGASNQIYIKEIERIVLKKSKNSQRPFIHSSMVRKTTITTRVLQLIHNILRKDIHITKRDLFYTDVKLFTDQAHSDGVLDDVACMLGCTRTSLNVGKFFLVM